MATVFYSWQADRPPLTGRNFVERALERAAAELKRELELVAADRGESEPLEIDRDTKGVSGSPLILETIFQKIDGCRAFVADLTFVGERVNGQRTPNPNVLIEYGWALKSKGRSVVIGVMNSAYGHPTEHPLPFDLRHQRNPITYDLAEGSDETVRARVKGQLVAELIATAPPNLPLELPTPFVPRVAVDGGGRLVASDAPWGIRGERLVEAHERIFLLEGPVAWLRLYPKYVVPEASTDLLNRQLEAIVRSTQRERIDPLVVAREQSYFRRADGFGVHAHINRTDRTKSLAVVFKNREIWAADRFIMDEQEGAVIHFPEPRFFDALDQYMRVYRNVLKVKLPWVWEAGVEGLDEKFLLPSVPRNAFDGRRAGPATHDKVVVTGEIDSAEVRSRDALRPFIDAVYDAFGSRPPEWLFS
jgi:hypothetical protein